MKLRLLFLVGVLLFVFWSLFNVSEGFQSTPETAAPEETKCTILRGAHQTLQTKHDDAIKNNNPRLASTLTASIDSVKNALKSIGC